jgi:hypothetical protein
MSVPLSHDPGAEALKINPTYGKPTRWWIAARRLKFALQRLGKMDELAKGSIGLELQLREVTERLKQLEDQLWRTDAKVESLYALRRRIAALESALSDDEFEPEEEQTNATQ